jgi:aminopeptidase S
VSRVLAAIACLLLAACDATVPTATVGELPSSVPRAASSPGAPSVTAGVSPSTHVSPSASPALPELSSEGLREALDIADIRAHLDKLAGLTDAAGGTRASGSAGHRAALDYVAQRMQEAGLHVERVPFEPDDEGTGGGTNLLAEITAATEADEVLLVGAHLDSVPEGPGINDNASGVATLLALAEAMANFAPPSVSVRFAFWDGEEIGHLGSEAYVRSMTDAERDGLAAYLNADILASPNFVRYVYDEPEAAEGSAQITELFATYFDEVGLAWVPVDLSGKSDHASFTDAGIATGGLFSGGTESKTDAEAAVFGGSAGEPADPCIHRACDTLATVNEEVLEQLADALAHAVAELAR